MPQSALGSWRLFQLEETAQLGRALWRRRVEILAFFDHHASNGPT
jgi:transposase